MHFPLPHGALVTSILARGQRPLPPVAQNLLDQGTVLGFVLTASVQMGLPYSTNVRWPRGVEVVLPEGHKRSSVVEHWQDIFDTRIPTLPSAILALQQPRWCIDESLRDLWYSIDTQARDDDREEPVEVVITIFARSTWLAAARIDDDYTDAFSALGRAITNRDDPNAVTALQASQPTIGPMMGTILIDPDTHTSGHQRLNLQRFLAEETALWQRALWQRIQRGMRDRCVHLSPPDLQHVLQNLAAPT